VLQPLLKESAIKIDAEFVCYSKTVRVWFSPEKLLAIFLGKTHL